MTLDNLIAIVEDSISTGKPLTVGTITGMSSKYSKMNILEALKNFSHIPTTETRCTTIARLFVTNGYVVPHGPVPNRGFAENKVGMALRLLSHFGLIFRKENSGGVLYENPNLPGMFKKNYSGSESLKLSVYYHR